MTANMNQIPGTASVDNQSSTRSKSSKRRHEIRPKPLLSQVIGIRLKDDEELGLVTTVGLVDVSGEYWTTETLADELFYCLVKKEAEPELISIRCANNEGQHSKSIDLSELYESSKTLLYGKCIILAEQLASTYDNNKPIIFVINLSDLPDRLKAELIDLQSTKSSRATLAYVLHSAVARIFALACLSWFYESAFQEIKVILQP